MQDTYESWTSGLNLTLYNIIIWNIYIISYHLYDINKDIKWNFIFDLTVIYIISEREFKWNKAAVGHLENYHFLFWMKRLGMGFQVKNDDFFTFST